MQEMHAVALISSAHGAAHWATVPAHLSQFLSLQPCMNQMTDILVNFRQDESLQQYTF